jgi:hypothetical protein
MATQYTSILKLALPVQGELSGTWGDVVNDNITSMVEEAIAGRKVINSWTANSHTLTTADGTTSESRAAILSLTDTGTALTGAGTVICPAASKVYIVENGTGEDITVKTSSGTGIVVPDGKNALLFCDGTNVEEGISSISGALDVGGTTSITADSTRPLSLSRTTDEGEMIRLSEGTSIRGVIGFRDDKAYMYSSGSPSGSGFVLSNATFNPAQTSGLGAGQPSNGITDLGGSSTRWKDLYLSGGVSFDPNAAANKLDDYEEGTFTPQLADADTSGNQATFANSSGRYRKVGSQVFLEVMLNNIDETGMTSTSAVRLRNLPFTAIDNTNFAAVPGKVMLGAISNPDATNSGSWIPTLAHNSTIITFRANVGSSTGQPEFLLVSDLSGSQPYLYLQISYMTA